MAQASLESRKPGSGFPSYNSVSQQDPPEGLGKVANIGFSDRQQNSREIGSRTVKELEGRRLNDRIILQLADCRAESQYLRCSVVNSCSEAI